MQEYHELVINALLDGTHKPNRTGVDTISTFGEYYEVDLADGYPLLTTKKMDGFRWDSMLHEFVWFLSGEEHIRDLREETGIWDAWADDEGRLDTAYGRFWRRFPIPDSGVNHLDGETWAGPWSDDGKWTGDPNTDPSRWVNTEETGEQGVKRTRRTFDQIQYVLDMLDENPHSRRLVVTAWHPANAAVSTLPPCHYTFAFNVQGDGTLNVHLTQRSGDIALGIPFNIACYSLLAKAVAQHANLKPGKFAHSIVDAHVYCGEGERGQWYTENLDTLQHRLRAATPAKSRVGRLAKWVNGVLGGTTRYAEVADWIESEAPADPENYDHVPGLLRQLSRTPKEQPTIEIADKPLDDLTYDDIALRDYDSYEGIKFGVAE